MAEALRNPINPASVPDRPNMNVVPPAAPLGSADAATTAGAGERGDAILRGDEVEADNRPSHLLEPYSEAREREWPLGAIPGARPDRGIFHRAGDRLRSAVRGARDGSLVNEVRDDIRDRAEGLKDRAAYLADDLQHSSTRLSHELQHGAAEWKDWTQDRVKDLRASTGELINQRPARAIAVAAGIGLALGIVLRLGRSHREY